MPSEIVQEWTSPPIDLDTLSSVLLIRVRSLGDTVLMTPAIAALRRWRADLHIAALVEARFAAVLRHNPKLNAVLELETAGDRPLANFSHKLQSVGMLRRRAYDLVLNLHGGTTSLLYTLLARSRYTVGLASYRHAYAYRLRAPAGAVVWQRGALHTVENQLAPLKWLGIPVEPLPDLEVYLAEADRARARRRLDDLGLSTRPFVLIHPTATLFTKQWDLAKFSELVDYIATTYRRPVVLTVSPAERAVAQRIHRAAKVPPVVMDDLSLPELMAVIEQAALFIGCDSGPTHIAAALKKPIIVIFGSSNAIAWRPWHAAYELIRSDLPCIPCPGYRCYCFDVPKCIIGITVAEVTAAVDRMLKMSPESGVRSPES